MEEHPRKQGVVGQRARAENVELFDVVEVADTRHRALVVAVAEVEVERLCSRLAAHARYRQPVNARVERQALYSVIDAVCVLEHVLRCDRVERRLLPFVGYPPRNARFLAVADFFARDGVGVYVEGNKRRKNVAVGAWRAVFVGVRACADCAYVFAVVELRCRAVSHNGIVRAFLFPDFIARHKPSERAFDRVCDIVRPRLLAELLFGRVAPARVPHADPVAVLRNRGVVYFLRFVAVDVHRRAPPLELLVVVKLRNRRRHGVVEHHCVCGYSLVGAERALHAAHCLIRREFGGLFGLKVVHALAAESHLHLDHRREGHDKQNHKAHQRKRKHERESLSFRKLFLNGGGRNKSFLHTLWKRY